MNIKLRYNSPVIITYTLMVLVVMMANGFTNGRVAGDFFSVSGRMEYIHILSYWRLFSHVIGHVDWSHFVSNFSIILLIGPILEDKYRSLTLLLMMLAVAFCTSVFHIIFFSGLLMGASGIAFMFILLVPFSNVKKNEIPLSFLLVFILFFSKEMISVFKHDPISQFSHIVGGMLGILFGFIIRR